jgi:hypothetical protein
MLNKETKDKLVAYGFDVSKLEEAIKAEAEVSLEVPALKTEVEFSKLMSEEDKTVFGKNRFEDGKKAMSEIKAKELKEKHGIEIEGKDLDAVVEAYVGKKIADTGAKPAEWAEEKKTLQKKIEEAEQNLSNKTKEFSEKFRTIETSNQVASLIPDGTVIAKDDLVTLFNTRYRIAPEDGRTVIFKGSEKLQDNRLEPLPLKDVVASFLDEGKYLGVSGMGGKDIGGKGGGSAKFKTLNEFNDYCETQDINPMSEEGQKVLSDRKDETVSSEEFYNS